MGRYVKLSLAVLVLALGYVGFTYAIPYSNAYLTKSFVRNACNDLFRKKTFLGKPDPTQNWHKTFIANVQGLGIKLNAEQYDFEVLKTPDGRICNAKVAFSSSTRWEPLDTWVDIKPIRTVHRINIKHNWRKNW